MVGVWTPSFCAVGLLILSLSPGVSDHDRVVALAGVGGCLCLATFAWLAHTYMRLTEQLILVFGGVVIIAGLTASFEHTAGLPFFSILPLLGAAYLLPTRISIPLNVLSHIVLGAALALRPDGMDWLMLGEISMINGASTALTRYLRDSRDELIDELERLAATDALTGLANRGTFELRAVRLLERARRDDGAIVLVMFDLDHFKALNDRQGHAAGDTAIVRFSEILLAASRPTDLVARIGGEEFVAVIPAASPRIGTQFAERVAAALREQSGAGGHVLTVSAGVAPLRDEHRGVGDWLSDADRALYAAKAAGRDRVILAEPAPAVT